MQPDIALVLTEAAFWILLILSAPFIGSLVYTVTLPLWHKIFRSPYIELTFKEDNKTLKVVVNRDENYIDDVEKALERAGFE